MRDALAFDLASTRTIDQDGHLHVSSLRMSKACVSHYAGMEIPNWDTLGLNPDRMYALYRDPEEMRKAAATFNGKPLTLVHKKQTAGAHDHAITVGSVSNVTFDGTYLKGACTIWDQEAIDGIADNSRREISCGYRYVADMTPRTTPDGTRADGTMRSLAGNHVTLVPEGRVASECWVGDSAAPFFVGYNRMSVVQAVQETLAARDAVRPYVGDVMAMDSANAVYAEALTRLGHDSAPFRRGGAEQAFRLVRGAGKRVALATDAQQSKRAAMFPHGARLA